MAEAVSANTALVEVRQEEGGRWRGYITQAWFRYLVGSNPDSNGAAHQVLHGNPGGAPTWGPVDLTDEVSGRLPVANGGTNLAAGISGGILGFIGPTTIASSALLAANRIVLGGGPGATPSTPLDLGFTSQVLHGNNLGPPTWGPLNLTTEITGTLAVLFGGTGTTTSTGGGSTVRSINPTLTAPILVSPSFTNGLLFTGAFAGGFIRGSDNNQTSVTAVATTIMNQDKAGLGIVHDLTSGGVSLLLMDATGGVVVVTAGIAGIAFTRLAATGLQAAVTAGVNPRLLSVMFLEIGSP